MNGEQQIIAKVLDGDVSAFEELVQMQKSQVFKIVASMVSSQDIDEVAHEAFIRIYKDLGGYSHKAPFQHWLSKVVVRTCYDYWRKERRQKVKGVSTEELNLLEAELAGEKRLETSAIERAKELLDWALGHLSPQDRLAFSLLYLEEMSMKEVGDTMGWSLAQVKTRSFRARRRLRSLLKDNGCSGYQG